MFRRKQVHEERHFFSWADDRPLEPEGTYSEITLKRFLKSILEVYAPFTIQFGSQP